MASGVALMMLFSVAVDPYLSVPSLFCIVLLRVAVLLPSSVVSAADCWALLLCVPVVLFHSVFLAEVSAVFVFHVSSIVLTVHC